MIVTAVKTPKILPYLTTIGSVIEEAIAMLKERSIVVVTSKIVSICENRVVPIGEANRDELIKAEADLYYKPREDLGQRYNFTVTHNTLIPASGIDSSNGNDNYILWPKDPQASANAIRRYLVKKFGVKQIGVIITDSTIGLSRWGTLGIAIAHSGFLPIKNYIGQEDLFGRELVLSKANVAGGLASAAVVVMGEGSEQTPIAVIEDVPFVEFVSDNPRQEELAEYYVSPLEDEPFAPFFNAVQWHKGGRNNAG
jgi:F420-0:gamma-glutamyl ligase